MENWKCLMTTNMSWVLTCIALCAPPALILLSKRSKRSDVRTIPIRPASLSCGHPLNGKGRCQKLLVPRGSLGVAKTLLVLFVLSLASVQAFVAVGLMTVRRPRCVEIPRHAKRSYLAGRVVWVTGASSGLGEQIAISAVEGGAAGVILSGRRKDELERVRSVCEGVGPVGPAAGKARVLAFDMAESDKFDEKVAQALGYFGRIDTLVFSAGVSSRASVEATELDVAKKIMTVNYFGPVGLSKALLAARGRGDDGGRSAGIHFVVVNSVQGKFGIAFRSSYTASKHALVGFFDCLRAETSHLGVRVTSVFPGYIRTNLSLNALTGDGSKHAKMDPTTASGRDPRKVADQIWKAAATGKNDAVLADLKVRVAVLLRALLPGVLFKILARRALKEIAQQ